MSCISYFDIGFHIYCFVKHKDGLKYKKMVDDSGKRGGEIGIIDGIACALQHCSAWP
jgi:hypothetical protein